MRDDIDFIVMLAGTGIPGGDIINMQTSLIAKANGQTENSIQAVLDFNSSVFNLIKSQKSDFMHSLNVIVRKYVESIDKTGEMNKDQEDQLVNKYMSTLSGPWFKFFVKYDPALALEKVKCPVFALNGSKDLQVPAVENLAAIKGALLKADNQNFEVHNLDGLNHLFQECKTGNPSEYGIIEQTISPRVLHMIYKWMVNKTDD